MQPNDQVIQEKLAVDEVCGIALENLADPTAAAPKMNGVAGGNMVYHSAHRRMSQLQGEANVAAFAPAAMNRPSTPKEHALRGDRQSLPIVVVLHQRIRASSAQTEMNNVAESAAGHWCRIKNKPYLNTG
jgi:hypothetical protein